MVAGLGEPVLARVVASEDVGCSTIPQGNCQIVIRIMEEGGARTNYYRVSVAGKEALTVTGEASVDKASTHIPIGEGSFDEILPLVDQLTGGEG